MRQAGEDISEWRGRQIVNRSSEKFGKIEDVYYDTETDEPVVLSFKTGVLGHQLAFVPPAGAPVGRDYVQVTYEKDIVADGPTSEPASELSAGDDFGRTATTSSHTRNPFEQERAPASASILRGQGSRRARDLRAWPRC